MNAWLATDLELDDLVSRADPMRDPRVQAHAGMDTESALRLLAPELDRPARPRTPRRHRGCDLELGPPPDDGQPQKRARSGSLPRDLADMGR